VPASFTGPVRAPRVLGPNEERSMNAEAHMATVVGDGLPPDARVLGVFLGNRRYYCDRDLIFDETLEEGIRSAASAEALGRMLRDKGFTHVVMRYDLFDKFILSRLSADRLNLFHAFIKNNTAGLFSEGGHIVFELK
jgi:hypothetical protein